MNERQRSDARGEMKKSNKVLWIITIVIALAGISTAVFLYMENQRIKTDPSVLTEATKKAADEEARSLKAKVAKLMQLPSDEDPVVATVSDKEKLKDQPFFKEAENGDRILIFTEAKKAVIYREKDNRLINVGPIAVTSDGTSAKVAVSMLSSKGADTAGAAEAKLSTLAGGLAVTKGSAANTHSSTKVFDASGSQNTLAAKIAGLTGGEVVTSLPQGETAPEGAQIVVFVAQ